MMQQKPCRPDARCDADSPKMFKKHFNIQTNIVNLAVLPFYDWAKYLNISEIWIVSRSRVYLNIQTAIINLALLSFYDLLKIPQLIFILPNIRG